MSKTMVGILSLILGLALGWFVSAGMTGVAAGIGIATGLSSGVCMTVKAAEEEGLLDTAQVDQVLNRAATDLREAANLPEGEPIIGSAAQCDEVLTKLREAGNK